MSLTVRITDALSAVAADIKILTQKLGNKVSVVDDAWHAPSLQNGWANYGGSYPPAGYFVDELGIVRLRGLICNGSVGQNYPIFTLPVGYRPKFWHRQLVVSAGSPPVGDLFIKESGEVFLINGSNGFTSLDGVTFRIK